MALSQRGRAQQRGRGFTYLGVLFLISVLAITAEAASVVWSIAKQRDDVRELVFIGRQFAAAIDRYRAAATDPAQLYPRQLEDLLHDDRSITPARHLRRLYIDPMTGDSQWGLIRLPDSGIVGVHSLSDRKPFPRQFVDTRFSPPPALTYREWRFIAPGATEVLEPATTPAAASAPGLAPSLQP
jgi:type II secretory pathway pseudopilin PulG